MSLPLIAWNNLALADDTTITVVGSASGYPLTNIDYRPYLRWRTDTTSFWVKASDTSNKIAATCWGLCGHNLSGVELTLESADDGSDTERDVYTPSSNKAFLTTIDSGEYKHWKLSGSKSAAEIGVFYIGGYLEFEQYPNQPFDPDEQKFNLEHQVNNSGHLIGANETFSNRTVSVSVNHNSQSWGADFVTFRETHKAKPFFWAWDIGNNTSEAYYSRIPGGSMTAPYNGIFRETSFTMEGPAE